MPGLERLAHLIRPAAGEPEAALVLLHGRETITFGRNARAVATEGGAEVLYRECPVGHFIDPHVVPELTTWVQDRRASSPLP
jgi:hypothetical protein